MRASPRGAVPTSVTDVWAIKVRPGRHVELPDRLVTEEPLEIRCAGPGQDPDVVAVTMRTPGHDFELAAGFLVTEGLAKGAEVAAVGYCADVDPEQRFNTVIVSLRVHWQRPGRDRVFAANSSCGVCGKAGIDQVVLACPTLPPRPAVPASLIPTLPDRLRATQRVFDRTGGLHGAGLFALDGTLLAAREDIGRHNAVDKVVGAGVLDAPRAVLGPPPAVLMVSGRVSFEIVQKAAMAGIGLIAAVSAPSSLAVAAAERLGVTVAAFVRGDHYSVYSHPEGISLETRAAAGPTDRWSE